MKICVNIILIVLMLPLYAEVDYNSEIQPIFNSSCINCHNGSDAEEDLSLTSYDNLMMGGESGDVVIPYDPANSLLWVYVNSGFMPPYGSGNDILTTGQINLIAQWIDEGALPESNEPNSIIFEDEVQLFQDSAHQKFPELVSTDDGILHLVWVRELGSNKNVMYSNSTDNGVTYSDPIQINHNSNSIVAYIQAGPKIKVRGNELLIAYMDHRSGLTNIYLNYSIDNGLSWSEDILVSDQSYLQAYPDFEVAPNGIIHLIYYSYNQNNSFNSVRYSTAQLGSLEFSASTAVGVTGDANEPCDCCQPDMEISSEGDIYIAYRNNVENIRDIYIAIKAAGSDGFNDIIRASFHNDYNNHCPSSGPSMQIENNMIALSYRVSDAATSYIDYSDISIFSFDNAVMISSSEGSPNFSDILFDGPNVNEDIIHVGWIDYETGNPDVLYGTREIGAENLMNIQTMNQNIEDGYIMQKDPKLHRHNDEIFYFWSDKRGTFYQLYYRKSASNYLLGDLNYDNSVDILDIIILVNHILSPAAVDLDGADINNDGEVNILDIVALVNIILST